MTRLCLLLAACLLLPHVAFAQPDNKDKDGGSGLDDGGGGLDDGGGGLDDGGGGLDDGGGGLDDGSGGLDDGGEEPPANPPVQGVVPPELTKFVEAVYPEEALKKGITTAIIANIFIDETGKVVKVEIAQPAQGDAANQGFEDAALKALQQFEFKPALNDGKPIPVKVQYRYEFVFKAPEEDPIVEDPGTDDPPPVDRSTLPVNLVVELRERGTRKPIDRAAVTVIKGDESYDEFALDGRYEARGLEPGVWTIIIEADGYAPVTLSEEVFEGKLTEASYFIERNYYEVFDGKGEYQGDSEYVFETTEAKVKREVSIKTISVAEVQRIPGNQGDAIKVIQNLPGVARSAFGGGQIVIRGSAPEDSEVLLDGSPIPLLFHFGGLSAVVNSDVLESINFIPGNFSVRYGRAIGGIVDVTTRRPNPEKYSGYVNVDVLNTVALVEGPIAKGFSFQASARRSYIDAILPFVIPEDAPASLTVAPRYWDYQMRINWGSEDKINGEPVHEVEAFSFGSDDVLEAILEQPSANNPGVRGTASTATNFHRGQLRWRYRGKKLRNSLLYNVGGNGLNFALSDTARFNLLVIDHIIREELNYDLTDWLTFTAGLDMRFGNFDISVLAPRPPQEGEVGQGFGSAEFIDTTVIGTTYRPATFLEATISPTEDLSFIIGDRLDYDRSIKEFSNDIRGTFRYQFGFDLECDPNTNPPEGAEDPNNPNPFESSPTRPDPFATADAEANSEAQPCVAAPWRWAIKGGIGTFHQAPEDNESSEDFGNPELTFQQATHYTLGFESTMPYYEALFIDVTGFYKRLTDMISPSEELVERNGETVQERLANTGTGNIWGAEVLLRHNLSNNFFGWISYTLSFSERQDKPGDPVRPFSFDQTHIFTIIGSYKFPDNWQVGLRWRYTTGNPYTTRSRGAYISDSDDYESVPGETNAARIDPFHQLDLRVDKSWIFDTWILNAYIDIQNVYYNANPEAVSNNFDFTQSGFVEGLPILPSFGVRGQF